MDDDQQFCLRWNNHQSTLISVFDTLLENGTLVDCTLAAEGKFLKAHKVVLSACSPYFAALLSQQYDKHPIFILKDVKFQELRAMMDYMYRGEVNISQDQLAALLKAAESLQIKGLSDNRSNSVPNKTDNIVKPPPPVPVAPKGGLTISDAKRKQLLGVDMDTDLSTVSREGSTSPSRKRKKVGRRRSIDANNVLDNHEHSNSSSHSHTTPHIAAVGAIAAAAVGNVTNNIATSTPIVLPVTKKTDPDHDSKTTAAADNNATEQSDDNQTTARKDGKRLTTGGNDGNETHSELMIEPKNEYDEEEDEEGRDVEDLTLDDEDMMDDMDQAGPSHGGESSSGYGNWQMERSQDEGFMVGQDGGQPRDAQEIRPISTKKSPKLVEKSANVSITPVGQLATTKINITENKQIASKISVQVPTQTTSIIPAVKKVSHPRIKYSKLVNPSAQLQQTQNIIETVPQIAIQQQQQQQQQAQPQFFITRKILPVQTATPVTRVISSNTLPTQILKVFTDYDGNSIATLPTQHNQSSQNATSQPGQSTSTDFSVGIVDDLDYTGIDDIELPDDVHFTDSFKSGTATHTFKTHDQSNNSISSNSNDPTVLHATGTDKYTIFQDGSSSKFDAHTIHLSENSMSDADDSKQYACQHCGKRYRWKSTLRRHENVECGGKEASHQCPYCPYKAKQRGNLGVHVRKHHSNLPPLLTRRNKKAFMGGQLSSDEMAMSSNKSF